LSTAGWSISRRWLFAFVFVILALLLPGAEARAAAPANDAFASAEPLPASPNSVSGSNVEATKEFGEPDHAGNVGGHSVWYSWTPTTSGPVSAQAGSCFGDFDALVGVYTGASVEALSPVASNASPFASNCFFTERPQAEWEAVAGTTYWIAVDAKGGVEGSFTLELHGRPENDDFDDAQALSSGVPQNVAATTRLSDKETGEPDHAGDPGGHSVWFTWTPASSERVRIFTCTNSSTLDALLAVYTGSQLDTLSEVAANDEAGIRVGPGGCRQTDSAVAIDAVAGTTYRIAVDGANGTSGRFGLRIEGRPANDAFESAQFLSATLPASASQASNEGAGKEVGEPDHAGVTGGHSVWFEWIAPVSGQVRIATCSPDGVDLDTVLGVYKGSTLGGLTEVAANDDGVRSWCRDHNSEVEMDAVSGTIYKIAVDTKGDAQGRFGLSIDGPGANDDFADPRVLPDGLNLSIGHSNALATKEAGEPDHAAQPGGASVWFSWTAPSSGPVSISTCPYFEEAPDTLLAVYTGSSLSSLVPVAASDDSQSACQEAGSEVAFEAVAGTTYRIAVDSKDHSDGLFSLEVHGRPANDNFNANHDLNPGPFTTAGSTRFASKEAGEPNHAGDPGGHSVWFNWTATETGPVDLYACGRGPGVDTLLAAYTGGNLGGLVQVAANDDVPRISQNELCSQTEGNSEVVFTATAGTTYWIAVDTKNSEGSFLLNLEDAPQNDDLANAQSLYPGLPTASSAFTKLASKESGEPDHAGAPGGYSVWFSWEAPGSGSFAIQTCTLEAGFDTVLGVYTGSDDDVAGLTPVASSDDGQGRKGCRSTDSVAQLTAVAGTTYLIAVDGKAGSTGGFQLIVEGIQPNDDFGKAQPLGGELPTQSEGSNRFAGIQSGEPEHAGVEGGSSVWFKWTAPRSGTVSVDACDSDFDTLLAVYTGATLGSLAPVQSNDNGGGSCAPGSQLSFEAVANTTYRIALDGKEGGQGTFGLYLEEEAENDDFQAAAMIPGRPGWYWPGSTMLASKQSGEPDHEGDAGGHSVWFSWTPQKSWMIELDVCASGFEPIVGVYTGSAVGSLTPVETTDAGSGECDAGRSVAFTTVPGTTYSFAVDGSGGDRGHFLLHLRAAGVLPHTLSISRIGAGTVDASLAGLDCGTTCSHDFEEGTAVVLTASPAPGFTFVGWSGGGCSGTGRCQLAVNGDMTVTATFEAQPSSGGDSGGGGTQPPPAPTTTPPPLQTQPKKPLKCKRGFRKKTIHGKKRCVKKKKVKRHHRR